MWEDPIVEDVHAIRDQLLARFGGDVHRYCEYVRSLSLQHAQGKPTEANASPSAAPLPADSHGKLA